MRSAFITGEIWGREMSLERLEERVVLDGSLDHHMSYAYAPDPGAVACDHHMSYAYAPDPGALAGDHHMSYTSPLDSGDLVRDIYDGQIHQLDAWAYVWYDGTYLWYWTNNNWDAALNVAHGWFFVWTGNTDLPEYVSNAWNYCDWGTYWQGHGEYILGDYVNWGGGDTDWQFELHDVTYNCWYLNWACFNLGADGIFNPVDNELIFVSEDFSYTWEYTDPDSLVVWMYDWHGTVPTHPDGGYLCTVAEVVDTIGILAQFYGPWDIVAIDDHGTMLIHFGLATS